MKFGKLPLLGLLCLLLSLPVLGQDNVPWLDNYQAALAEAKRTQKPIFLEFRCEP